MSLGSNVKNFIARSVAAILHAGVRPELERRAVRAVTFTNCLCFISSAITFIFAMGYLSNGESLLAATVLPVFLALAAVVWLNHREHYDAARGLMLSATTALVLYHAALLGYRTHLQFFFIPIGAAPFLLYPTQQRKQIIAFMLLPLVCFFLAQHNAGSFFEPKLVLTPGMEAVVRLLAELFSIALTMALGSVLLVIVEEYQLRMLREHEGHIEQIKLASLTLMAGGVAHEVNNPLAIISGRLHQITTLNTGDDPQLSKIAQHCASMEVQVQRISEIVNKLQLIASDDKLSFVTGVTVRELVDSSLGLFHASLRSKAIALSCEGDAFDLVVQCNQAQVMQAFISLLDNAVHAVADSEVRWIKVLVYQQGQAVAFSIIDSGPGVPEGIRPFIMQPFFTTQRVGTGKGLGLSIAQRIAEVHGGSLAFDEEQPHTCFTLLLPLGTSQEGGQKQCA